MAETHASPQELSKEGAHIVQQEDTSRNNAAFDAVPVDLDDGKSVWQILRENPRVVAYAMMANAGSMVFGYDILVTGACVALPAFSMSYGDFYHGQLILPATWQSLWTSFVQLGVMAGSFGNGFLQDRFGRKVAYALGSVITGAGAILAYFSPDMATLLSRRLAFFFAKILVGVGMGILLSTCQTYVSEISPPRLRGLLLGLFAFMISVGQMVAVTLVFTRVLIFNPSAFKVPFAVQWGFSGLAFIAAFIIPESPTYLLAKEDRAGAEKAYIRLHGSKSDVLKGLDVLQLTIDHEKASQAIVEDATYRELFQGTNMRRTWIIILVQVMQHFLGISLLSNVNYFLIMAGMSPTQSLRISQIGIGLQIIASCVSWFTMSWLGRRFLILCSTAACGITFIGMGIAGFYQQKSSALYFIGAACLIVGSFSSLGVGSAAPVVANEVSSLRLRAKASGLGFFVNALGGGIFAIIVPYLFNSDAANLGGKIGLFFAGTCLFGFVLAWFVIPETKSKTYEQLDHLFEMKTATRAFKKDFASFATEHKGEN